MLVKASVSAMHVLRLLVYRMGVCAQVLCPQTPVLCMLCDSEPAGRGRMAAFTPPVVLLITCCGPYPACRVNACVGLRLFETLDPTLRRARLPSGRQVILSDTVGFISDLPTVLISSFKVPNAPASLAPLCSKTLTPCACVILHTSRFML